MLTPGQGERKSQTVFLPSAAEGVRFFTFFIVCPLFSSEYKNGSWVPQGPESFFFSSFSSVRRRKMKSWRREREGEKMMEETRKPLPSLSFFPSYHSARKMTLLACVCVRVCLEREREESFKKMESRIRRALEPNYVFCGYSISVCFVCT